MPLLVCFLTMVFILEILSMADMAWKFVVAKSTNMFSSCEGVMCCGVLVGGVSVCASISGGI